ncbi:MAG TPA: AbrB/MazE/SpoVT family DNA-binding domain-containing protein [Solirubrobacteraceae bacterium]|nr:AbrB/MazE/SpoVT family DNA-binding domain-containing protein [Solirubrobacteraceae bacterium]
MSTARIYKKGQVTIPKAVRDATGFNIGDRVIVEARENEIVLRHPVGVLEFAPPASAGGEQPWPAARRAAREERAERRSKSTEA